MGRDDDRGRETWKRNIETWRMYKVRENEGGEMMTGVMHSGGRRWWSKVRKEEGRR